MGIVTSHLRVYCMLGLAAGQAHFPEGMVKEICEDSFDSAGVKRVRRCLMIPEKR
jgi:hypothetical protein